MMGNDEVTERYIDYLTQKYASNENTIPHHTGGVQDIESYPTHTGGEQVWDTQPWNTGGEQLDGLGIKTDIEGNPIVEPNRDLTILPGNEIHVGDWRDSVLEARNKETIEFANKLGYKNRIPPQKAPFNSHGQPVYWNGKNYITPDIDEHNTSNGWKMFDRKGKRLGTYDENLNRIKD